MSKKFRNKYKIESARLKNWDYGSNAAYFVTICTKNRVCFFGDVVNTEMKLSRIGQMAHQCWLEIPEHFPFVVLDEFVIMPNHVHGIIIIDKPGGGNDQSLSNNKFGPQSQNLASIIRGFKIGVTKYANEINAVFSWQPRFHDHIIRNDKSFQNIRNYIRNNPKKWNDDQFFYE